MTVSTETYRTQANGNGVTTAFSVPFPFLANSHISVVYTDADSVDTTWVENTHYTLTGAGGASGTLTAVTAPATGTRITIIRDVPLTQTTDYVSNDEFPASTHESNLDKTMMAIQMLQEQLDRAIKVKTSSTAAPVDEADVASAVAALSATAAAAAMVGTSTSSLVIGTGSKTFTVQANRSWRAGDTLLATSDANPTVNFMVLTVTSYSGTTLVGTVASGGTGGSGTYADWTIRVSGIRGPAGTTGAGTGDLLAANDLSDVANKETARVNLGIDKGRGVGDTDDTMTDADRFVYTTAVFTAPRTWTLPAANAVPAGHTIVVFDDNPGVTATNTLTLARAGADTIDNATSFVLRGAYTGAILISDGTSEWSAFIIAGDLNRALNNYLSTAAQGAIVHRGASSWGSVAAGTVDYPLVSNGAGADLSYKILPLAGGGTGVALSDPGADRIPFWDDSAGNIAWLQAGTGLTLAGTTLSASGSIVLLTSGTVAVAATLDIVLSSYTSYRALLLVLSGWRPATDAVALYLRTDSDGGASYDAGASDYSFSVHGGAMAASTGIELFGALATQGNDAGYGTDISILLQNQTDTGLRKQVTWHAVFNDTTATPNILSVNGAGRRNAVGDVDAIRLLYSAGNITEGKYALYGLT